MFKNNLKESLSAQAAQHGFDIKIHDNDAQIELTAPMNDVIPLHVYLNLLRVHDLSPGRIEFIAQPTVGAWVLLTFNHK